MCAITAITGKVGGAEVLKAAGAPEAHVEPTGATAASRPEDILPDDVDRTEFGGVTVRKGTIAAFLQNASRWSDPGTTAADRQAIEGAIIEAMPALRAVGLFSVLEARDERLRDFLAHI